LDVPSAEDWTAMMNACEQHANFDAVVEALAANSQVATAPQDFQDCLVPPELLRKIAEWADRDRR